MYVFDINNTKPERTWLSSLINNIVGDHNEQKELTIDSRLYMIGYNGGINIGLTKQGLNAQFTSGKLTQLPDGSRLLYSIPTMQGSSGSPIIDAYGNFVGVNFAKFIGSDNFNFGIPAEKVRRFIEY